MLYVGIGIEIGNLFLIKQRNSQLKSSIGGRRKKSKWRKSTIENFVTLVFFYLTLLNDCIRESIPSISYSKKKKKKVQKVKRNQSIFFF